MTNNGFPAMRDSAGSTTPRPEGFGPGGHGGPGGHPGHGGPIADAATALGMTSDEVFAGLQQGNSLEDLATAKGISKDDLIASIKAAIPTDRPAPPDFDTMLADIVTRKGLPQPGPGGHHGSGRPDCPPSGQTTASESATSETTTA